MKTIVRITFGSHLYGTSTPMSDLDYKSVFVPPAQDILLQRVKGSVSTKRPKAEGEKNCAGEIDEEAYSVQRYLSLLAEGQTVALDVLFAPRWAMVDEPAPEWQEIVANRHRLITRRHASFLGYCRQQANKYGIKGSRVAAARKILAFLNASVENGLGSRKLAELDGAAAQIAIDTEHVEIVPMEQFGGTIVNHLEVCGRKLSYNATIRHGRDVMQKLVDEYGHRALQAEQQEGVDWKALSHAVRVGHQALELLAAGHVTFPLPNAPHISAIKAGTLPYQQVAAEIEDLLVAVEEAAAKSSLPLTPDHLWIDGFVADCHRRQILAERAA